MPHSTLIPPDLVTHHDSIHRLCLDPLRGPTPRAPWAPITDTDRDALATILMAQGCGPAASPRVGRPMAATPRDRLDATFRAVARKHPQGGRAPWRLLPAEFGKPDTASRTHRRWAVVDLRARLLVEIARPDRPPVFRRLTHRVRCASRRAVRRMGLQAIVLARRLGLYSALPAPLHMLPDPDLSEIVRLLPFHALEAMDDDPEWVPPPALFRALRSFPTLFCGGRARSWRWMEPA